MKQLLAGRGIQLTKSLGQNFLHDGNQLRRITAAAELNKGDKVLEIGPGLGPLTEHLMAQAGAVLAIEKDARLVAVLHERFEIEESGDDAAAGGPGSRPTPARQDWLPLEQPVDPAARGANQKPAPLRLLHDDALEFLKRKPRDWSGWKLVSNLPYSVASPILVELALTKRGPDRMVATLQLEVAGRLMARPADDDYGLLTVLVQLHYEPIESFRIPAGCFFPEPDVDSACVSLARRVRPLAPGLDGAVFAKVVKRAFSQRRKMLGKLLKADWEPARLKAALDQALISPLARAETVSVEQFAALARALSE